MFLLLSSAFLFLWSYCVMSQKRKIVAAGKKLAIVQLYEKKKKQTEKTSLQDLNRSVVSLVVSHYRKSVSVENRPQTERPPILSPRAKRVLFKDVKKSRNAPLQEITNTFNQGRPRRVSQRTIWHAVHEEGYQRRKICGQLLPNTFHQKTSSSRTTMRQFTGRDLSLNLSSEIK